jgi:hypothetical protein
MASTVLHKISNAGSALVQLAYAYSPIFSRCRLYREYETKARGQSTHTEMRFPFTGTDIFF